MPFRAKHDKRAIMSWKLDLENIRRAFDVSSFTPFSSSLTFPFQSEFAASTDFNIPDAVHEVPNIHTTLSTLYSDVSNVGIPEVNHDVLDIHVTVSGVGNERNRAVSTAVLCPSSNGRLSLLSLTPGQASQLAMN